VLERPACPQCEFELDPFPMFPGDFKLGLWAAALIRMSLLLSSSRPSFACRRKPLADAVRCRACAFAPWDQGCRRPNGRPSRCQKIETHAACAQTWIRRKPPGRRPHRAPVLMKRRHGTIFLDKLVAHQVDSMPWFALRSPSSLPTTVQSCKWSQPTDTRRRIFGQRGKYECRVRVRP